MNRPEKAEAYLDRCTSLSKKYSLAAYENAAESMQGFVRVVRGDVETGVRQAEAALETLKSVPTRKFHLPIRMSIVGRAKAAAGDVEGALATFESALDATSSTGEIWYEPETLRLKAEMLLALPEPRTSEAELCLTAAISSAQKQDAKFWELRAATVLAGLWARQGRRRRGPRSACAGFWLVYRGVGHRRRKGCGCTAHGAYVIMARIDLPTFNVHVRSLMRAGPRTGASAADLRARRHERPIHVEVVRANWCRFGKVHRRSYQNIWWCEGQRNEASPVPTRSSNKVRRLPVLARFGHAAMSDCLSPQCGPKGRLPTLVDLLVHT